jgi:hypothetical protein
VQTFQQGFIMLDYYTNTKAFAKNCENIARPQLHCNGKCQMMKKLKEEQNKDQQSSERKGETRGEAFCFERFSISFGHYTTDSKQVFGSYYQVSFPKGIPTDILHPPGIV